MQSSIDPDLLIADDSRQGEHDSKVGIRAEPRTAYPDYGGQIFHGLSPPPSARETALGGGGGGGGGETLHGYGGGEEGRALGPGEYRRAGDEREGYDFKIPPTPVSGSGAGASETKKEGKEKGSKKKGQAKEGAEKVKRTRQSQSCDPCRARKVKCDQPPPDAEKDSRGRVPCSHCVQLHLDCTYEYRPKKRGPPNLYVKRLQAERTDSNDESGPFDNYPTPIMSNTHFPVDRDRSPPLAHRELLHNPGLHPAMSSSYAYPPPEGYHPPSGPGGTLSSQNSYGGSALAPPGQGHPNYMGKNITSVWDETLHRAVAATSSSSSHRPYSPEDRFGGGYSEREAPRYSAGLSPSLPTSTLTPRGPPNQRYQLSPSFSSPQYPHHPSNPTNILDQVLPRGLLLHVVDLYFDYIYALIPAIHRPTFMRDLANHREDREGEEEWTHMVLILVAATLVQVPRAFVPLPRSEVKALAEHCYQLTREFQSKDWQSVSLERWYSNFLGYHYVGWSLCGANTATLIRLKLHQESTYANMPPIEREFRRRLFWLAFGSDRSTCAVDGLTTLFAEDECDVELPSELDDEYITEDGYLEQPPDTVPLITGFNYISKIFRLSGQVMVRRRQDRRSPPSGIMLQMRLTEVSDLYDQIMSMMDDCPEALRLDWDSDTRSVANFSEDWDAHASADIRSLFFDPKASRAVAKDAFLVQQANIYVTQQMVRYITLQYRDDLLALRQTELVAANNTREPSLGPRRQSNNSARRDWSRAMFSEQQKDQVATDLLGILQKIPIQVIAVNSAPLVVKVRFVASTLLDALTAPSPSLPNPTGEQARAETRTQKAQGYLWDFLRILSEIEALYSFEENTGGGGGAEGPVV